MNCNHVKPKMLVRITKLGETIGYNVTSKHIDCRQIGLTGIVEGYVPGHGGEVWWVSHRDPGHIGEMGAYAYDEFELVPIPAVGNPFSIPKTKVHVEMPPVKTPKPKEELKFSTAFASTPILGISGMDSITEHRSVTFHTEKGNISINLKTGGIELPADGDYTELAKAFLKTLTKVIQDSNKTADEYYKNHGHNTTN